MQLVFLVNQKYVGYYAGYENLSGHSNHYDERIYVISCLNYFISAKTL